MPVINFMGTDLYIQMKPTFRGAKAPVLKKVPYTADNPTLSQRKARSWLATTAHALIDTIGTVADTGHGIAGPKIAREIYNKKPGIGTHGGKSSHDYCVARRVPSSRITDLQKAAGA